MTATEREIGAKAQTVFETNNAFSLATTGGLYSPWVLGSYFASEELRLFLFLEAGGKSIANLQANTRVSFIVSQNDAQKDFVQGIGTAQLLPLDNDPMVRALLERKMPWYKTYTPVVPVRIDADELFVSSFSAGWFPAKRLAVR